MTAQAFTSSEYKYGFVTECETESFPKGLNELIIQMLSEKKEEPEWMFAFRKKAFRKWQEMKEPHWPNVTYPPLDYQAITYFSAPKIRPKRASLNEVDPEV